MRCFKSCYFQDLKLAGIADAIDAIIDGVRSELKTTNGTLKTIAWHFNDAIKQGKNIFLHILSDFSEHEIYTKIIGELKNRPRYYGKLFVYIDFEKKLYSWSIK